MVLAGDCTGGCSPFTGEMLLGGKGSTCARAGIDTRATKAMQTFREERMFIILNFDRKPQAAKNCAGGALLCGEQIPRCGEIQDVATLRQDTPVLALLRLHCFEQWQFHPWFHHEQFPRVQHGQIVCSLFGQFQSEGMVMCALGHRFAQL